MADSKDSGARKPRGGGGGGGDDRDDRDKPRGGKRAGSWQERLVKRRRARLKKGGEDDEAKAEADEGEGEGEEEAGGGEMSTRDLQGVLVCCQVNRRRECTRNMIEWFTDVADKLYPPAASASSAAAGAESEAAGGEAPASVADELERELAALKEEDRERGKKGESSKRFCVLREATHAGSIFLIESKDPAVDVVRVCAEMMRGILERGDLRCRYAIRLCPVEATCFSSAASLARMAPPLLARRFAALGDGVKTFAVRWDRRAHHKGADKAEFIRTAASSMPAGYKVDLKRPDAHLLLQLLGRRTCLAVVAGFEELCSFNVQTAMARHGAAAKK